MGNIFSNSKAQEDLSLSNGATAVLISVLLLAGSDLAGTRWEEEKDLTQEDMPAGSRILAGEEQ